MADIAASSCMESASVDLGAELDDERSNSGKEAEEVDGFSSIAETTAGLENETASNLEVCESSGSITNNVEASEEASATDPIASTETMEAHAEAAQESKANAVPPPSSLAKNSMRNDVSTNVESSAAEARAEVAATAATAKHELEVLAASEESITTNGNGDGDAHETAGSPNDSQGEVNEGDVIHESAEVNETEEDLRLRAAALAEENEELLMVVEGLEARSEEMREAYALLALEHEEERNENDGIHGANAELVRELDELRLEKERLSAELDEIHAHTGSAAAGDADGSDEDGEIADEGGAEGSSGKASGGVAGVAAALARAEAKERAAVVHWRSALAASAQQYERRMATNAKANASLHRSLEVAHSQAAELTATNATLEQLAHAQGGTQAETAAELAQCQRLVASLEAELAKTQADAASAADSAAEAASAAEQAAAVASSTEAQLRADLAATETAAAEAATKAQAAAEASAKVEAELREALASTCSTVEELEAAAVEAAAREAAVIAEREKHLASGDEARKEMARLSSELKEAQGKVATVSSELGEARALLSVQTARGDDGEAALTQLRADLGEAQEALASAKAQLQENGATLEQQSETLKQQAAALEAAAIEVTQASDARAKVDEELASCKAKSEADVARLTSEVAALTQSRDEHADSLASTKATLVDTKALLQHRTCHRALTTLDRALGEGPRKAFRTWKAGVLATNAQHELASVRAHGGFKAAGKLMKDRSDAAQRKALQALAAHARNTTSSLATRKVALMQVRRALRASEQSACKKRFATWLLHMRAKAHAADKAELAARQAAKVLAGRNRGRQRRALLLWRSNCRSVAEIEASEQHAQALAACRKELMAASEATLAEQQAAHEAALQEAEARAATAADSELGAFEAAASEERARAQAALEQQAMVCSDLEDALAEARNAVRAERARRAASRDLVALYTALESNLHKYWRRWAATTTRLMREAAEAKEAQAASELAASEAAREVREAAAAEQAQEALAAAVAAAEARAAEAKATLEQQLKAEGEAALVAREEAHDLAVQALEAKAAAQEAQRINELAEATRALEQSQEAASAAADKATNELAQLMSEKESVSAEAAAAQASLTEQLQATTAAAEEANSSGAAAVAAEAAARVEFGRHAGATATFKAMSRRCSKRCRRALLIWHTKVLDRRRRVDRLQVALRSASARERRLLFSQALLTWRSRQSKSRRQTALLKLTFGQAHARIVEHRTRKVMTVLRSAVRDHATRNRGAAKAWQLLEGRALASVKKAFKQQWWPRVVEAGRGRDAALKNILVAAQRRDQRLNRARALMKWLRNMSSAASSGKLLLTVMNKAADRWVAAQQRDGLSTWRSATRNDAGLARLKRLVVIRVHLSERAAYQRSLQQWRQWCTYRRGVATLLRRVALKCAARKAESGLGPALYLWSNASEEARDRSNGARSLARLGGRALDQSAVSAQTRRLDQWHHTTCWLNDRDHLLQSIANRSELRASTEVVAKRFTVWAQLAAASSGKEAGAEALMATLERNVARRSGRAVSRFKAVAQHFQMQVAALQGVVEARAVRAEKDAAYRVVRAWRSWLETLKAGMQGLSGTRSMLEKADGRRVVRRWAIWLRFIEFKRRQGSGLARALVLAEMCTSFDAYHRVFTRWRSGAKNLANFEKGAEVTSSILSRASTQASTRRFQKWSSLVLHASQRDKKWASVLTQASKRQLNECLARGSSALRTAARLHYRRQVAKRAIQRAADRKERQCIVRSLSTWRSAVKLLSTKRRALANVALLGQRKAHEIAERRALRMWHSSLQSHATAEQRLRLLVAGATKTWLRERQRLRFVNWRRRVAALVKHEAAAKVLMHMFKGKLADKQRRGWRALAERHQAQHAQQRAGRSIGLGGGAMSRALVRNQKRRLGRALACMRGHAASAARDARDSAKQEVAMLRVVADEHKTLQASNQTLQQEHGDLQAQWSALTAASTDTSQDLVTVREALEAEKALAAQRLSEIEAAASQAAVAAVEKAAREEVINDMKERLAAAAAAAEASSNERAALMEQVKAAAATAEELHSSHERKHASLKADAQAAAEKAQEALTAAMAEAKEHAATCSATESKLREELAEHRTKVAAMETALATAAGQAGDLSGQRSQLTEDLANLREAHSLASMKTVELTGKLEAAESAMEEVQARLSEDLRRERDQHAAALQAEKERSAALGQEASEERSSKAQVERELAAVSGDKRALEMQVQQSARAAEVDANERQALQAEAARLRQEMVELERAREAATRDGSGLQGQLASQSERGSALLQELSAAREELASLRAGERAHNATYENARQEIKELRAVERAYHELRAAASASAAEGEACAQSLASLQLEQAGVSRELEQARQRLESEAMRADESAASLAGARQELARLEGRCASLAAAQGPITELTERLMEQLKGKEADALQMGHLEELTQSLEHRCAEATHEGRRLNDTLNALADLATRAATHSQENLAATAADSPSKPQGSDYPGDPLGLGGGSGHSFNFGGGGSDGVSRSLVRMDENPSRSNSLVGHPSSSSSGGGAATARTAVEALARLVGRLTDKIEAGRRSHQARVAAEAQKVEALEGEVAASKERERAASAEAARLAAALAAKGRDVADAKSAVASADAAAATAAAAAADAGNRCAALSEQLADAEAHTRRETAARAALEQETSRLTVAAATSSAEREELSRLLRSARLRATGGSHTRQQALAASGSSGEDSPSLVSMATELTLGLTQAEEDAEAAKAQSEALAAQLRATGEELEQKRQALHEATVYGKAQTQRATSLATAEEARGLLAREVARVADSLRASSASGQHRTTPGRQSASGSSSTALTLAATSSCRAAELLGVELRAAVEEAFEAAAAAGEANEFTLTEQIQAKEAELASALEAKERANKEAQEARAHAMQQASKASQEAEGAKSSSEAVATAHEAQHVAEARAAAAEARAQEAEAAAAVASAQAHSGREAAVTAEASARELAARVARDAEARASQQAMKEAQAQAALEEKDREFGRLEALLREQLVEAQQLTARTGTWGEKQRQALSTLAAEAEATQRLAEAQAGTLELEANAQQRAAEATAAADAAALAAASHEGQSSSRRGGGRSSDLSRSRHGLPGWGFGGNDGGDEDDEESLVLASARELRSSLRQNGGSNYGNTSQYSSNKQAAEMAAARERRLEESMAALEEETEMARRSAREGAGALKRSLTACRKDLSSTQAQYLRFAKIVAANMSHLTHGGHEAAAEPSPASALAPASSDGSVYLDALPAAGGSSEASEVRYRLEKEVTQVRANESAAVDAAAVEKARADSLAEATRALEASLAERDATLAELRASAASLRADLTSYQSSSAHPQAAAGSINNGSSNSSSSVNRSSVHAALLEAKETEIAELKASLAQALQFQKAAAMSTANSSGGGDLAAALAKAQAAQQAQANAEASAQAALKRAKTAESEAQAARHAASQASAAGQREAAAAEAHGQAEAARLSAELESAQSALEAAEATLAEREAQFEEESEALKQSKHAALSEARAREAHAVREWQERCTALQAELVAEHTERSRAAQTAVQTEATIRAELAASVQLANELSDERDAALRRADAAAKSVEIERGKWERAKAHAEQVASEAENRAAEAQAAWEAEAEARAHADARANAAEMEAHAAKAAVQASKVEASGARAAADAALEKEQYSRFLAEARGNELYEAQMVASSLEADLGVARDDAVRSAAKVSGAQQRLSAQEALRHSLERQLADALRAADSAKLLRSSADHHHGATTTSTATSGASGGGGEYASVAAAAEALSEERRRSERLSREVAELTSALSEGHKSLEQGGQYKASLEQQVRDLRETLDGARRQVSSLEREVSDKARQEHTLRQRLEAEVREKQSVQGTLEQTRNAAAKAAADAEAASFQLEQKLQASDQEIHSLRAKLSEAATDLRALEAAVAAELKSEVEAVKKEAAANRRRLTEERDGHRATAQRLEQHNKSLAAENAALAARAGAGVDNSSSSSSSAVMDARVAAAEARAAEAEDAAKRAQSELTNMAVQQASSSNSSEVAGLRQQLSEALAELSATKDHLLAQQRQQSDRALVHRSPGKGGRDETQAVAASAAVAAAEAEASGLRSALAAKADEVAALVSLNEQLLARAEHMLRKQKAKKEKESRRHHKESHHRSSPGQRGAEIAVSSEVRMTSSANEENWPPASSSASPQGRSLMHHPAASYESPTAPVSSTRAVAPSSAAVAGRFTPESGSKGTLR